MKKLWTLLCILACIFCIACGKKEVAKPIIHIQVENNSYITEDEQTLVDSSYPVIALENGEVFPSLEEGLELLNDSMAESSNKEAESLQEIAELSLEHGENPSMLPYINTMEVARQYCNANYTSFFFNYYYFTGGAHGNPSAEGILFDNETGEEMSLAKILLPGKEAAFRNLVKKALEKQYPNVKYFETDLEAAIENFVLIPNDNNDNFYLDEENLTLLVNPYILAPYSEGILEAKIAKEDLKEIIVEKYLVK